MGSLTAIDKMQMELDRLQNVEYAMRRLNAELQIRVEDLETQLLENTDLGWHNLRNQRDDLLKRNEELGDKIQHEIPVLDMLNDHYRTALEEIVRIAQSFECNRIYKINHIATAAIKPCDPTE